MPVREIIESPHRFKERIVVFGGAGVGKSSITCNIAKYMPNSQFHVIDMDYSMAYERLVATEYPEVEETGNLVIHECDTDWEAFTEMFAKTVDEADPDTDWLTVDPTTVTWQLVQSWWAQTVYGANIADYMAELRKNTQNADEYNKAMTNDMTWPAINKQYQERFYRILHKWRGHIILVCEPAEIGKRDDADIKSTYGFVGYKPSGQKALPHIGATNLFLDHPKIDQWRMTSIKDRGRQLVEKMEFTEFAIDYLVGIGGWESKMVKV